MKKAQASGLPMCHFTGHQTGVQIPEGEAELCALRAGAVRRAHTCRAGGRGAQGCCFSGLGEGTGPRVCCAVRCHINHEGILAVNCAKLVRSLTPRPARPANAAALDTCREHASSNLGSGPSPGRSQWHTGPGKPRVCQNTPPVSPDAPPPPGEQLLSRVRTDTKLTGSRWKSSPPRPHPSLCALVTVKSSLAPRSHCCWVSGGEADR